MSASGKSALCSALLADGVFTSEVGVGNIRVSEPLTIGSTHATKFVSCKVVETTTEPDADGAVKTFHWLSLGF